MTESLLDETIDRVPDWTQGAYDASRIFHSGENTFCVIIKPFLSEYGNRDILRMALEAYVPANIYLFFNTDTHKLAQEVRRFVIYNLGVETYGEK